MNDDLKNDLEVFKSLKGIEVVVDVGSRHIPYLEVRPKATYHLFEPNPEFFAQLPTGPNIFANNYGLGDVKEMRRYNTNSQAFDGGEIGELNGTLMQIRTLDWYIKSKKIERIDFLKIDTEGYDYKVLLGGKKAIKLAKYIQYETWHKPQQFVDLLGKDFDFKDVGYRNILCTRKSPNSAN